MLLREVEYARPQTVDEAVRVLAENDGARPLAGGQTLINVMKSRAASPDVLVDLQDVEELRGIRDTGNGGLEIGAMTTYAELVADDAAGARSILGEVASAIADVQVRNRGTIGGSVAHADPSADYPTVLKALGATITATGKGGERTIAADDFFRGIFTTALEPDELVTSINVPATPAGTGAAYVKHRHPASFYAVVGIAAVVSVEGGKCTAARITIGGVTSPPVHATGAAGSLVGSSGDETAIAAAAAKVPEVLGDAIGDSYASGEYRTHLAEVLTKRALEKAFERAT
jgi:aerobic carbon-monoxide dehydrogenase medium subunit